MERRPATKKELVAAKAVAVVCWVLIACGNTRAAHGSPLDCEQIRDSDQRHFCRAISIPRKSECEFIKQHDLRFECRARVK